MYVLPRAGGPSLVLRMRMISEGGMRVATLSTLEKRTTPSLPITNTAGRRHLCWGHSASLTRDRRRRRNLAGWRNASLFNGGYKRPGASPGEDRRADWRDRAAPGARREKVHSRRIRR